MHEKSGSLFPCLLPFRAWNKEIDKYARFGYIVCYEYTQIENPETYKHSNMRLLPCVRSGVRNEERQCCKNV